MVEELKRLVSELTQIDAELIKMTIALPEMTSPTAIKRVRDIRIMEADISSQIYGLKKVIESEEGDNDDSKADSIED